MTKIRSKSGIQTTRRRSGYTAEFGFVGFRVGGTHRPPALRVLLQSGNMGKEKETRGSGMQRSVA